MVHESTHVRREGQLSTIRANRQVAKDEQGPTVLVVCDEQQPTPIRGESHAVGAREGVRDLPRLSTLDWNDPRRLPATASREKNDAAVVGRNSRYERVGVDQANRLACRR